MTKLKAALLLGLLFALPVGAQQTIFAPITSCFAAKGATYRIVSDTARPDFMVKLAGLGEKADLRLQVVEQPELADLVLVDDADDGRITPCESSRLPIRTVSISANAPDPDLTISVTTHAADANYKVFVRSANFTAPEAAALFALVARSARRHALADN